MTIRALHLVARPDGVPKDSDFELREGDSPALEDGQLRIAVRYLSIDPAMRVWMSEARSYWPPVPLGDVMRAQGIGEVVESRNPKYPVGGWVSGMTGVRTELVSDGKGMQRFDAALLPHPGWALSVFGATGLSAWVGLTDIGKAKAGETLVVSAAAGAVGSNVVQIGKALGLRVIGIAGGPDKCAFVRDTLGADAAIDYKAGPIGTALREHCPDGVDVYFDNVGGDVLDAVLLRLARGARVVVCGAISQYNSTKPQGPANYLSLLVNRASMTGIVVFDYAERYAEGIAQMATWRAEGRLKSLEDVVSGSVADFPETLMRLFRGDNHGKLVLKIAD